MKNIIRKTSAVLLSAATAALFAGCTSNSAADNANQVTPAAEATPAASSLSDLSFDTMYGTQFPDYLGRQYYFEGEPLPIAETDYYYVDSFITLTSYATYGIYPSTADGYLDLSAAVESSTDTDYQNYGDFLTEYTERIIESTAIINKLAEQDGLTLSQETLNEIEDMLRNFDTNYAQPEGMTLDQLLQLYYGPECSEAALRQILQRYYLAELYTNTYIENYEFSDEEINVPNIRYTLYWAPEGDTSDEDMAAAEASANALLESCNDSIDNMIVLGQAAQSNGEATEYGEMAVMRGRTVSAFEEWAYGEGRTEGEMGVIYAPEYGYFVVGYVGTEELSEDEKQDIAVSALGDSVTAAIDNNEYEFYTNDVVTISTPDSIGLNVEPEQAGGNSATSVLVRIFAVVGGLLLVGAVVLGIQYAAEKKKAPANKKEAAADSKKSGED